MTLITIGPYLRPHIGKPCPYCGEPMNAVDRTDSPTRDHVFSKRHRLLLKRSVSPIVICCHYCNELKGGRTLVQWLEHMRKKGIHKKRQVIVQAYINKNPSHSGNWL